MLFANARVPPQPRLMQSPPLAEFRQQAPMTLNSDNFSRILEVLSKMAEEAEGTNVSWPNVLNYPPGGGLALVLEHH